MSARRAVALPMDPVRDLLLGAGLPAAVSAAGIAALHARGDRSLVKSANAPVLAAAALAGVLAVLGLPAIPPVGATDALPWILLAAGVAGWADTVLERRGRPVPGFRAGVAAAIVAFLLRTYWTREAARGDGFHAAAVVGACAACVAVAWNFADGVSAFLTPTAGAFVWMLTLAGSSVVLLRTGNALLAQVAGAVAAALGPAWVWSAWRGAPVLAGGTVAAAVLPGAALLLAGHFFGELPLGSLVLAASAPAFATILASLASACGRKSLTSVASTAGAAAPLGAAIALGGGASSAYV